MLGCRGHSSVGLLGTEGKTGLKALAGDLPADGRSKSGLGLSLGNSPYPDWTLC